MGGDEEYQKIGHQIGQGMHPIGNQARRSRQQADQHLERGQAGVDRHADPGAARGGPRLGLRIDGVVIPLRNITF
jgi:hypothetical protein